ncbi:hypothetical protein [Mycobacterium sp. 236(2023)]|uniref:hypothetical protein n=1 Tax=Mycobacterium sp. 236(2023) TaxID=3038163 RepID=UPI002414F63A|nr:hypothetical protein [Mycobacterium sp. 236(2023)]MDG4668017.1 hypothetical protein [Mycobacterium sp. 236(2023)]
MSAPDVFVLMSTVAEKMPDAAANPEAAQAAKNSYLERATTTPRFPWGDVPPNGWAQYIRDICQYIPDAYPDRYQWAQQTSGAMFLDAVFNCEVWAVQNERSPEPAGARYEKIGQEALDSPKAKVLLGVLTNICPQLK